MCFRIYTQQQLFDIRRVHVHKFIYCVLARAKRVTRPTERFYWIAERRGRECASDLLLQILDFRCINPHKFLGALIFYAPHRFICMRMAAPRAQRGAKRAAKSENFVRAFVLLCYDARSSAEWPQKVSMLLNAAAAGRTHGPKAARKIRTSIVECVLRGVGHTCAYGICCRAPV